MPPPSRKLTIVLFALFVAVIGLNIGKYAKSFTLDTTPGKPNAASRLNKDSLHRTTYKLTMKAKFESGSCSATAIGPHALLTAAHCEYPEMKISVGSQEAIVVCMIHDGNDHVILLLEGITFHNYATFAEGILAQGEHVFLWGNPLGIEDMYREGYVAGFKKAVFADGTESVDTMLTANIINGDSGAAVFNMRGEIVGVFSYMSGQGAFLLEGMLPLKFTDDQLKEASNF